MSSMMQAVESPEKFQCKLCGARFEKRPAKCLECGCPNIRNVAATSGEFDVVTEDSVKHLKRKLEWCWNEKKGLPGQGPIKHKFLEEVVSIVDVSLKETHDALRCKTCKRVYNRTNGRAATEEELKQAENGEIESTSTDI